MAGRRAIVARLFGAAVAFGLCSSTGAARADDARTIALEYESSANCPDRNGFVQELRRHTRVTIGDEAGALFVAKVLVRIEGDALGSIEWAEGDSDAIRREVRAPDCREVVAALALILGLALDPEGLDAEPIEPPEPSPSAPVPAVTPPAPAPDTLQVALGAFGKWIAIGVALGLLGSGVLMTPTANKPTFSRGPAASSVAAAPKPTTTTARALPPRELEESAELVPSSAPVPAKIPSARVPVPSASASPSDSLALEIALLGAARRELQAGNAAEALRALDAYEKAATRHALAAEAMLLRVRALVSSGRQAEARALVARYTRSRPNDAYAKKLTELMGGPTP